jgi:hypothetical protein
MFWGRFGPFRYCPKVDAKLAELAPLTQKFAKQSSVGTFHNIHTDPSIGPKTHVLAPSGPFRYCTKVDAKLAELAPLTHKFANEVESKFLQRTHLIHSIGPKTHVLVRFVPFRYCTNVDAKLAKMWQNQPELYRFKYASPLPRAPTCFKRYNPLACRVTSR